jgi:hypothetical protein
VSLHKAGFHVGQDHWKRNYLTLAVLHSQSKEKLWNVLWDEPICKSELTALSKLGFIRDLHGRQLENSNSCCGCLPYRISVESEKRFAAENWNFLTPKAKVLNFNYKGYMYNRINAGIKSQTSRLHQHIRREFLTLQRTLKVATKRREIRKVSQWEQRMTEIPETKGYDEASLQTRWYAEG